MQQPTQEYKFTLKGILKFELISLYGRIFLQSRKSHFTNGKNYLNLGCGGNVISNEAAGGGGHNIINADFFSHLKPYKNYSTPKPQWQLDMRYPFKCPNDVFDGVFTEHVLEHFYIDDARALLKEIYRILKPNGTLRLSVPDLGFRIQEYLKDKQNDSTKAYASEHIRKLTQEYLHLSVWDYERLYYECERIGFVDIALSQFGNGRDKNLIFDLKEREYETLYVEASKPS
ncbi:class I SAM-dependent methyltransferase [uncultured Helicobacter sp.]|uniref:class I SAM-dependent methyltransferase n=1 Tax=uncultured Helicobacter sp. TaxID=175537 RepID=UPI0026F0CBA7|nr:class I SAM-dependent methyltransferase [uncultured Helicobacter sp.]